MTEIRQPRPSNLPIRRVRMPPGQWLVRTVRGHTLATFYLLAVLLSWSWWIPVAVWWPDTTHLPGLVGPMLAAVLVTALVGGRSGVSDLVRRMGRWRVPRGAYLIAVAPLVTGALGVAVLAVLGQAPTWASLSDFPGVWSIGWVGVFVVVLAVNAFGEEVGWRGLAWPLLRQRHGLGVAAVLLAVPWALWHLPLFWVTSGLADLGLAIVPGWLLGLTAGSLFLGWLVEHARGSLLIVALFHATLNMASATGGTAGLPAALTSAVVIAAAVVIGRRAATAGPSVGASGPDRSIT